MQTFITDIDFSVSASHLDNKRLGKQRVEALQIVSAATCKTGWSNHPAVLMWRPYLPCLMYEYIPCHFDEWESRGYKNEKCLERYQTYQITVPRPAHTIRPRWLTPDFIRAHRSNLIRKLPEHYGPLFPGVPNDLPYIWPTKEDDNEKS